MPHQRKTALVTGANGFIGSHLTDALLDRGYQVRCLVRKTSRLRWLPQERVELVYGEVTDPQSLEPALEGAAVVFHLAGLTRASGEADYRRVNAAGAQNVARAAARRSSPPEHMVLLSSLAAAGPSRLDRPHREGDPDSPQSPYGRSKLEGEKLFREEARGVPWSIIRPPAVYGSRDRDFLILARMVKKGWLYRLNGLPQPASVVEVGDLVRVMIDVAETAKTAGRTYYVAHPEITTLVSMGDRMASVLGKSPHTLRVPRSLVPWAGRASGLITKILGKPNPLPPDRIRDLLAPAWTCDVSRVQEELAFSPALDITGGVAKLLDWYRSEGWL